MLDSKFVLLIRRAYGWLIFGASLLQHPFLLVIRLYWGWQFFVAGKGKLMNFADTVETFRNTFHFQFPGVNAFLAGATECFGGLFLMAGLASRLTALPLTFTMVVAYLTADKEALTNLFHGNPDTFFQADPFFFLLTSFIVLAFGPGIFSLDWLIQRKLKPSAKPA